MNSMIDDVELLRRYARDASEKAFSELVHRHIDLVYSAALPRVGRDTHLAQDITQKVFADLAQQAGSLAIRSSLAGWLYTRARFFALNAVQAEQRRRQREAHAQFMTELATNQPTAADWNRLRPVLEEAVDELKADDRNAILLRFFEHRAFVEIGALLKLSENAAQKRVQRSLEKLRTSLAKRGVTSTTAALALAFSEQTAAAAPVGLAASVTSSAMALSASFSSSTVSLLSIVSTTKTFSLVAAVLLIAAWIADIHEIHANQDSRAALIAANAEYDALLAKQRSLEQGVKLAELQNAQLKRNPQKTNPTGPAAANKSTWDAVTEGKAFLARHPEVRQAVIDHMNATLNFRFGALYKTLGLTPEQISKFQALNRELGGGPSLPLRLGGPYAMLVPGSGMPETVVTSQLKELLGDDGFSAYRQAMRTVPARDLTAQLAGTLALTDSPLTPGQSDQLIQIITANRSRGQLDWDAVVLRAQSVLSISQLAALTGMRAISAAHSGQ